MSQLREVERKFRLSAAPPLPILGKGVPIAQGYLIVESGEERVRRLGDRYYWTVKDDGGLARMEFEVEIPEWVFRLLWAHTEGCRIEKIRYLVRDSGGTIEVDIYQESLSGLVILECEFLDEASASTFYPPGWAGPAVDVTDDARYKNRSLATQGQPPTMPAEQRAVPDCQRDE